jgi:hypothetical protein
MPHPDFRMLRPFQAKSKTLTPYTPTALRHEFDGEITLTTSADSCGNLTFPIAAADDA